MDTAILHIQSIDKHGALCHNHSHATVSQMLLQNGHDVIASLSLTDNCDVESLTAISKAINSTAVIVVGDYKTILDGFKQKFNLDKDFAGFVVDEIFYLFVDDFKETTFKEVVIPSLNARNKTSYLSCVFRVFGLNINQIKDRLKDCVKNKNKVTFKITKLSHLNHEVAMRYSLKSKREHVEGLAKQTAIALEDATYAQSSTSLAQAIISILTAKGKTLCVAESFTGGCLSSSITAVQGASKVFKEGLCTYSNDSKQKRLQVSDKSLKRFGAVSIETVYEMAAHALSQTGADYCIATTGNAGPSFDKPNEAGKFFIAVGSKDGIHIFDDYLDGARADVIDYGVNAALFHLYKAII